MDSINPHNLPTVRWTGNLSRPTPAAPPPTPTPLRSDQVSLQARPPQPEAPAPIAAPPQLTACGFSGSPTLAMNRSFGNAWRRAASAPVFIIMRTAVGAVYQTLTRSRPRIAYHRSASKSASSTTCVIPCASGAMTPYEVPVIQPGSAVHQNTSSAWKSSARRPVA